jgi:hypothetical protein
VKYGVAAVTLVNGIWNAENEGEGTHALYMTCLLSFSPKHIGKKQK